MNPKASNPDHHDNSFLFGLTVGVLGALLLGTDEGKKLMKEIMDSLPENIRHLGQTDSKENVPDFSPPLSTPEETPHHAYSKDEDPPPPPPDTSRRPEYFYPSK